MVDLEASGPYPDSHLPLRFGPAGVPRSLNGASNLVGLREVARLGLTAMELAFVHTVNVREPGAAKIREAALAHGVSLSVHAPYYINLNSADPLKVVASKQRILRAARIGYLCGATHVVFHAAWRHDSEPEALFQTVKHELQEVRHQLDDLGVPVLLCPETTGKRSQFGSLDEVIRLAQDIPGVWPCVDFAHLHAYEGQLNTAEEFEAALDRLVAGLGGGALRKLHLHVSGIAYGKRGETHHLTLAEADLDYRALLAVMSRCGAAGRVICESPQNAEDAGLLAATWAELNRC